MKIFSLHNQSRDQPEIPNVIVRILKFQKVDEKVSSYQ
jgi:hypothetical protein